MAVIVKYNRNLTYKSEAVFSKNYIYRYTLSRIWNKKKPIMTFILLNPSTATERLLDPTNNRCLNRAKANGFGTLRVVNIFAFRATQPEDMKSAKDPVGPDNDEYIRQSCVDADLVICGWGNHGSYLGRDRDVMGLLIKYHIKTWCLAVSKTGQPMHPLYLSYDVEPKPFKFRVRGI